MFHDAPLEAVEPSAAAALAVHRHTVSRSPDELRAAYNLRDGVLPFIIQQQEKKLHRVVAEKDAELKSGNVASSTLSASSLHRRFVSACCVRIALQFPDTLLDDAVAVLHELERALDASAELQALLASAESAAAAHAAAVREQQQKNNKSADATDMETIGGAAAAAAAGTAATPNALGGLAARRAAAARRAGGTSGATAGRPAVVAPNAVIENPNAPTRPRLFILADNTFGSCCPDEITAQHYDSDAIVHFGDACMSRAARLPVFYTHPHFSLLPQQQQQQQQPEQPENSLAAARLVAEVVRRVRASLQRATRAESASSGKTPLRTILSIVGTYESRELLELARTVLEKDDVLPSKDDGGTGGASPEVDWSQFPQAPTAADDDDGAVDTHQQRAVHAQTTNQGENNGEGNAENNADADDESRRWTVNGVTFRQLSRREARRVAQLFLFVGPSNAPHLVHLQQIVSYNAFHARGRVRDVLEECASPSHTAPEVGEQDARCIPSPPLLPLPAVTALSIVDETLFSAHLEEIGKPITAEEMADLLSTRDEQSGDDTRISRTVSNVVSRALLDGGDSPSAACALQNSAASAQAALTLQRRLRQRNFNIETLRASEAVGVLVVSLSIRHYHEVVRLLHKLLRLRGKRSYVLYVGHLNEFKLANFADTVDCFVAVACPNSRVSHFPTRDDNFLKPVMSPAEALLALAPTEASDPEGAGTSSSSGSSDNDSDSDNDKRAGGEAETTVTTTAADVAVTHGMAAAFTTAFAAVLPPLRRAVRVLEEQRREKKLREAGGDGREEEKEVEQEDDCGADAGSRALVRVGGAGGGALTTGGQQGAQGALARLHARSYHGLEARVGETAVQESITEGKHGIARGYAAERETQGQ